MLSFYAVNPVDALVISNFREDADAKALKAASESHAFAVDVRYDASPDEILDLIALCGEVAPGAFTLFVLADGGPRSVNARGASLQVSRILDAVGAHFRDDVFKLVVFDGSRDGVELLPPLYPAESAEDFLLENALVAYSTQPHWDSYSAQGRSWFLAAFCDRLVKGHGKPIQDIVRGACADVVQRSSREGTWQMPVYSQYKCYADFVIPSLHLPER